MDSPRNLPQHFQQAEGKLQVNHLGENINAQCDCNPDPKSTLGFRVPAEEDRSRYINHTGQNKSDEMNHDHVPDHRQERPLPAQVPLEQRTRIKPFPVTGS